MMVLKNPVQNAYTCSRLDEYFMRIIFIFYVVH